MLNKLWAGRATVLSGVAVICFATTAALAEGPLKFRDSQFEPVKWNEVAGWTADDHLAAYAYQTSCQALLKPRRSDEREELPWALSNVCRKAASLRPRRKDISTQAVRDWMAANPDEAMKVRSANRSYVIFRITDLTNEGEPVGAQGVPLTPGRSIAVDRAHQYGTPFFIEAKLPIAVRGPGSAFRRLMIAQDTGSAIVGPARADMYWGAGEEASRIAGRIRHASRFFMLLPREIDVAAVGRGAPLPVPRPNVAGSRS
jgi:3D (Asp-Asp-Asp) domain-containing protein